jgi:hypothetical protein
MPSENPQQAQRGDPRSSTAPGEIRGGPAHCTRFASAERRWAIEGALERHAECAAKHVHVVVTDRKVVLSGQVPSWAELNTVEGAARGTPGVWMVDNQLRIQP